MKAILFLGNLNDDKLSYWGNITNINRHNWCDMNETKPSSLGQTVYIGELSSFE